MIRKNLKKNKLTLTDRIILATLMLFLTFEVFGGMLRYSFALVGVPWLIYIPKLLIALIVFSALVHTIRSGYIRRTLGVTLSVLFVFTLVSVYYTGNVLQAAFGLFVLMPFILGIVALPALYQLGNRILKSVSVLWLCAALGVVYGYLSETPWSGFGYEVGGVELISSRQWTTHEIARLAGFSRASYTVANQLLFLGIPILLLGNRWLVKSIIWITTGMLIALTTTKKTMGVYVFLTILFAFMGVPIIKREIKRAIAAGLPWIIVAVGIALPVSTLFADYSLDLTSYVSQFMFASLEGRLTWAWPDGFELVFKHGSPILGRGIGGIGVSQGYFEGDLFTFADNLYLYLYASMGIPGFLIIAYYTKGIAGIDPMLSPWSRTMWYLALAILMSGWATNGVEGAFISILLGLTFTYVQLSSKATTEGDKKCGPYRLLEQGIRHSEINDGGYVKQPSTSGMIGKDL